MYVDIKLDYTTQQGSFYTIQEMVDMNIFDYKDVYTIRYIKEIKDLYYDYVDLEEYDLNINKSLERQIAYDFKCYLNCDCESHDYNENIEYLGTYKGCVVMEIFGCQEYKSYEEQGLSKYQYERISMEDNPTVYDVVYRYDSPQRVLVWKPNE